MHLAGLSAQGGALWKCSILPPPFDRWIQKGQETDLRTTGQGPAHSLQCCEVCAVTPTLQMKKQASSINLFEVTS